MTDRTLQIMTVVDDTTADGPGFRTAIYAAGCEHRCAGCHNPQSWDISQGTTCSLEQLYERVCRAEFANVTFSGGDPLFQPDGFTALAKRIKTTTNKTIWCYTGYQFEQIEDKAGLSQILPWIDVLVDGRYDAALSDSDLLFRGSSNQRLIDIKATLSTGRIVLWQRRL